MASCHWNLLIKGSIFPFALSTCILWSSHASSFVGNCLNDSSSSSVLLVHHFFFFFFFLFFFVWHLNHKRQKKPPISIARSTESVLLKIDYPPFNSSLIIWTLNCFLPLSSWLVGSINKQPKFSLLTNDPSECFAFVFYPFFPTEREKNIRNTLTLKHKNNYSNKKNLVNDFAPLSLSLSSIGVHGTKLIQKDLSHNVHERQNTH